MVYFNTPVYEGEMSMVHPVIFLFSLFEALNDAFEVQFFRSSFLHLIKDTDSIFYRAMQLRFFLKWKHC